MLLRISKPIIQMTQQDDEVLQEIFEDPNLFSRLDSMQKIEVSFKKLEDGGTLHIGVLTQRVVPKGVLITMEHWAQIAFLRSALQDFIKFTGLKKPVAALIPLCQRPNANFNADDPNSRAMTSTPACGDENADSYSECGDDGHPDDDDDSTAITGKDYTQLQFWNYIDDYLNLIHTDLFQDVADPVIRRGKVIWFFNEALQIDIFNYKGSTKIPPPPSKDLGPLPAWQEALQCSVLPPITYAYMGVTV
ncbi:hypothetical protein EI94DRAFT_1807452 [Lactarius quietus]|nr:hypothetical protein EI94DRAFT_1807452 [Lactarius quietus]